MIQHFVNARRERSYQTRDYGLSSKVVSLVQYTIRESVQARVTAGVVGLQFFVLYWRKQVLDF